MNARDQVTIHSIAQLAASSCTHTPPSFPLHSVPTSTSPSQAPLPTPAPAARPPVPPLPHPPPPPTPLAYLHIPLPGCLRGVAQGIGEGVHQGQQEEHVELELRRLQQVVADAVKHLQPRGGGRRYKGGAGRGGGGGCSGMPGGYMHGLLWWQRDEASTWTANHGAISSYLSFLSPIPCSFFLCLSLPIRPCQQACPP